MTGKMCSVLVIKPLSSIINQQIKEGKGLGLTKTSLMASRIEDVSIGVRVG